MLAMTAERDTFAGMAAFLAVVDEGSFSKAAAKLGLTPSGVSKLVSRLEARFDMQLLHRTTRRVQLTDVGTFFSERTRRIFDDVVSLEREIEEGRDKPRGLLRVTAPVVLGQVRIMPVVVAFRAEFPDVRIELLLTDRVVDPVEERIDVATARRSARRGRSRRRSAPTRRTPGERCGRARDAHVRRRSPCDCAARRARSA